MRYRSRAQLFGWPLLAVATGPDLAAAEARGVARGIVAIGDVAIGGLAVGVRTLGGLAVGVHPEGGAVIRLLGR